MLHIKNKVICGSDQKPVSRESLEFRKAKKDKKNHTLFFINGGFSLDNLPSPPVVEETVKENFIKISSVFHALPAPVSLEAEAGETPSAVGHKESPQLQEDSEVVGGISQVSTSLQVRYADDRPVLRGRGYQGSAQVWCSRCSVRLSVLSAPALDCWIGSRTG